MVLLVLAVVWIVVIGSWFRSRSAGSFGDSVGTFHRHIRVLERATPVTVAPAHQLRGPTSIAALHLGRSPRPPAPPAVAAVSPYRRPLPTAVPGPAARRASASPAWGSAALARRRQSQRRRRDVLLFLLAGAAATLAIGAIPGLHTMLVANVVFDLLTAAYVGLLLRARNIRAERDAKLAFLPPRHLAPAGGAGRYGALGGGYHAGDLLLRPAAN